MPIPIPSTPASAKAAGSRTWSMPRLAVAWPSPSMGDRRQGELFRELHMLISAGVDPGTVFDVLAQARGDDRAKELYRSLRRSLAQGRTLAGAFAQEGRFSVYVQQSVQVGEETGRIAEVFAELAAHYEAKVELRRTLTSAIAYPAFVLFITGGVVTFMLRVVVPMFADVFKRSGAELPALTRAVMRLSGATGPVLLGVALFALALGIGYAFVREDVRVRRALSWLSVRVPLIGPIHKGAQFARFYRAMASMLAARLPLDRALGLASELVGLYDLRIALERVRERVLRGAHLHEACAEHTLFDPRDVAMIAVAEEVRQLDRMFLRMADERAAEVRHRTGLMGKVLEPVMIVFIAVFVGAVLVAMYLPMFKLSTAF